MTYSTPEETPGYAGLYGEVVTCDTYRVKRLDFVPDVVIDLGANIGVFTRFARELWPDATIIAVEPNGENFEMMHAFTVERTTGLNIAFIKSAIGIGKLYHAKGAANGSGECYLNAGLGYPEELMPKDDRLEVSDIETITLADLVAEYVKPGQKYLIKLDIEGNEHTVFTHAPSWECIKRADYFCAEIHKYAINRAYTDEVNERTDAALNSLATTHNIGSEHVHFWARKK